MEYDIQISHVRLGYCTIMTLQLGTRFVFIHYDTNHMTVLYTKYTPFTMQYNDATILCCMANQNDLYHTGSSKSSSIFENNYPKRFIYCTVRVQFI